MCNESTIVGRGKRARAVAAEPGGLHSLELKGDSQPLSRLPPIQSAIMIVHVSHCSGECIIRHASGGFVDVAGAESNTARVITTRIRCAAAMPPRGGR